MAGRLVESLSLLLLLYSIQQVANGVVSFLALWIVNSFCIGVGSLKVRWKITSDPTVGVFRAASMQEKTCNKHLKRPPKKVSTQTLSSHRSTSSYKPLAMVTDVHATSKWIIDGYWNCSPGRITRTFFATLTPAVRKKKCRKKKNTVECKVVLEQRNKQVFRLR